MIGDTETGSGLDFYALRMKFRRGYHNVRRLPQCVSNNIEIRNIISDLELEGV